MISSGDLVVIQPRTSVTAYATWGDAGSSSTAVRSSTQAVHAHDDSSTAPRTPHAEWDTYSPSAVPTGKKTRYDRGQRLTAHTGTSKRRAATSATAARLLRGRARVFRASVGGERKEGDKFKMGQKGMCLGQHAQERPGPQEAHAEQQAELHEAHALVHA